MQTLFFIWAHKLCQQTLKYMEEGSGRIMLVHCSGWALAMQNNSKILEVAWSQGKAKQMKKKSCNHQEALSLETREKLLTQSWPDSRSKREHFDDEAKLHTKFFHSSWFRLNTNTSDKH